MKKSICFLIIAICLAGCKRNASIIVTDTSNTIHINQMERLSETMPLDMRSILSVRFLEDENICMFYEKMDGTRMYIIWDRDFRTVGQFEIRKIKTEQDFMIKNNALFFSGYGHSMVSSIDAYTGNIINQYKGNGKIFNTGNEDKGGIGKRVFLQYDTVSKNSIGIETIAEDYSINWEIKKLNLENKYTIHGVSIGRSEDEVIVILSNDRSNHLFLGIYNLAKNKMEQLFETEYEKPLDVYRCLISPDKKNFLFYGASTVNAKLKYYVYSFATGTLRNGSVSCNSSFLLSPDWSFDSHSFIITDYENNNFYIGTID